MEGNLNNNNKKKMIYNIYFLGVGHDDKGVLVLGATNLPWALD